MKPALLSIILALFGAMLPQASQAQDFPAKTVRLVVPFPPGGIADALARILGEGMSKSFNQQVVVENRPGAGGNLAASAVATAPADGYALFLGLISTHAINVHLYQQLPYDPIKDFQPIGRVAQAPLLLVVPPSLPVKSVAEFIAHAKANPGKLNYGSAGNGSASHLAGIELGARAGVPITFVPYKGGVPALTDVAAGQAQALSIAMLSTYPFVKGGKLKLIAVMSSARLSFLPDVPTVAEVGFPGFVAGQWQAFYGPKGLSKEIAERLRAESTLFFNLPDVKRRFAEQGAEVATGTAEELNRFVASERAKFDRLVKDHNIKVD